MILSTSLAVLDVFVGLVFAVWVQTLSGDVVYKDDGDD